MKNFGMNVTLTIAGRIINLFNVTEIHYGFEGGKDTAFESDIHSTGKVIEMDTISEMEVEAATTIAKSFI